VLRAINGEAGVGDALEQFGEVGKRPNVAVVNLVRGNAKVVVAQVGQPAEHRVDIGFLGEEGGEGCCAGHRLFLSVAASRGGLSMTSVVTPLSYRRNSKRKQIQDFMTKLKT
jgi:hypothetical protein